MNARAGPVLDAHGQPTGRCTSRAEHLAQMKALIEQDILDMILTSVANLEVLLESGALRGSRVGTAIRANDTTDIWSLRHSSDKATLSLPHRTAHIPHAIDGRADVEPGAPPGLTDLTRYPITFTDDALRDRQAGMPCRAFRIAAERWGFKHCLEVFNPNAGRLAPDKATLEEVGQLVNDTIARVIAGVPKAARPQIPKLPFNGARVLEELVAYDPTVIVGILGGGAGTARDCFELLVASVRHGARLVLFGRKIDLARGPAADRQVDAPRRRPRDRSGRRGPCLPRWPRQERPQADPRSCRRHGDHRAGYARNTARIVLAPGDAVRSPIRVVRIKTAEGTRERLVGSRAERPSRLRSRRPGSPRGEPPNPPDRGPAQSQPRRLK